MNMRIETGNFLNIVTPSFRAKLFDSTFACIDKREEASRRTQIVGSWVNTSWPLRAAAVEANSPFLGKGWPKAGVGAATEAVRPLPVTRNSAAYITTPPFGHPFLKRRGIPPCLDTVVPRLKKNYLPKSKQRHSARFGDTSSIPSTINK